METLNADYIEAQYRLWKENPEALSSDWRFFFKGFELGGKDDRPSVAVCDEDRMQLQSRADALVHRYRDMGHLLACMDPLVRLSGGASAAQPGIGTPLCRMIWISRSVRPFRPRKP